MKWAFISFLLFSSGLSISQDIEGLAASYTFNNNGGKDDLSSNVAKLHNAMPTQDRFGNAGFAYYLQGNIQSYIDLGSSAALKPRQGSISLWVKIHNIAYNGKGFTSNPIIHTQAHPGDDFNEAYAIYYHTGLKQIQGTTSLSELHQAYVFTDKTTSLREWHHAVLTYDDSLINFYLDGVLQGCVTKGYETAFLEGAPVVVGRCKDNKNQRFLCGSVDDIEIYDRVLLPTEVETLYHAPNPNEYHRILNAALIAAGVIALIFFAAWLIRLYIRRAIRKEKEKDNLRNQWYEQENKVLKAQMNPHFIFNSLNTIQQLIILNENAKAQLYVSKFSKLIRRLLESNTRDSVSLREEIELCEKYLEIESMRFNNVFSYSIHTKDGLDISTVRIPNFLIQVFIENAIWHGLLPKDGDKQIEIAFNRIDENTLCCTIDDNGVGRKPMKRSEHFDEKKSLAIEFVRQRLSLYSRIKNRGYSVNIVDKFDPVGRSEGTRAILTIPILNN